MTWNDQPDRSEEAKERAAAALSAAGKTAQQALDSAKGTAQQALDSAKGTAQQALDTARGYASQTHLDDAAARAAAAASDLYQQGRDRLANSEELSQAAEQLSGAIRKNPLAAIGIAFSAGLLLALLARG
jgi:ElaB/YqjD/DUF883 family membrane-anchored ribosome-binding protein